MKEKKKEVSSGELKDIIVRGMLEKKASNIVVMDLRGVKSAVTDFFVVCSGTSDRQVSAIRDGIEEETWKSAEQDPWRREGLERKEWVLLDYVDVVAHIFTEKKRSFYGIEDLWGDAEIINVSDALNLEK